MSVHNKQLPPLKDAVVTINLDNETKTDTIEILNDYVTFTNVPHRFLNKDVHITVDCKDFHRVDTTLLLTKDMRLNVYRDADVYGSVKFRVWNSDTERAVAGVEVRVDGHKAISDKDGSVSLAIPLESQRTTYHVEANVPLLNDSIYMPCGENDVVEIAFHPDRQGKGL